LCYVICTHPAWSSFIVSFSLLAVENIMSKRPKRASSVSSKEKKEGSPTLVPRDDEWSVQKVEQLAAQLDSLLAWLSTLKPEQESTRERIAATLRLPVCRLSQTIVGSMQQKVDEIVYAEKHGFILNPNTKGVDMTDAAGRRIELKVSRWLAKRGCVNFNWPLPPASMEEKARRERLLQLTEAKVGNGGFARLVVVDHAGKEIVTFELSGVFLREYFTRLTLLPSNVHNMGCARCKTCQLFHRLARMEVCSQQLLEGKYKADEFDWNKFFAQHVKSQCSGGAPLTSAPASGGTTGEGETQEEEEEEDDEEEEAIL
jgi:hypothetical protein